MTYTPQRRKQDCYPGRLGYFIGRFFMVVGIAATISSVLLFLTFKRVVDYKPPALPEKIVLTYTLQETLGETASRPSLKSPLLRPQTTLREVVETLHTAAKDPRVDGLVFKVEGMGLGIAQVQELRAAVQAFRAARNAQGAPKFAWIYNDTLEGAGMGGYYLAAAFDKIWLQPVGTVALGGLAAEVPFAKGLLDHLGVQAQFLHVGKYKSMPESLTLTGMSDDQRDMMSALIADLSLQMRDGIAADRGMDAAKLESLMAQSPLVDTAALDSGLVDYIGYYDEMQEAARTLAGAKDLVSLRGYGVLADQTATDLGMVGFTTKLTRHTAPAGAYRGQPRIALVHGAGDIVAHTGSGAQAGFGRSSMAADKIVKAFDAAMKDDNVAAVVFRVDSPGGSPQAAESIRRAILRTQASGRPVVVSMGDYAASGGYWVAAPADKIVAQPGTVTGSIGVFGGKFVAAAAWKKLGVSWDAIEDGPHARMWSMQKPFSPSEEKAFQTALTHIYDAFLDRVAEGRGMTREEVHAVAQGRVWTGRQALESGLVDVLGGVEEAVALARALAGIPQDQTAPVLRFPPQKSTLEAFIDMAVGGADTAVLPLEVRVEDMLHSWLAAETQPLRLHENIVH